MLTPRIRLGGAARVVSALTCSAALAMTVVSPAADAVPSHAAQRSTARMSCSLGAAVAGMPFRASPRDPRNPFYDFEQFTATRNGVYAGVAYRSASSDFYLVSRAPRSRPVVLRKVHYPYAHATPNAVTAMGFTPQMNLVVAVQNPGYRPNGVAFGSYKGLYYTGRTAHYLPAGRWISYMPTGVADNGRISGWAATGTSENPHYYVVTWAGVHSAPVVLASVGSVHPSVVIDGNGDMAWQGANGILVTRLANGSMHQLLAGSVAASIGLSPAATSQNGVYASGVSGGVLRWTLSPTASAGTAMLAGLVASGTKRASVIDAVGPRGELVVGAQSTARYRMANGQWTTVPAQALPSAARSRVFSAQGVLALTSLRDRRVHFMTCR